MMAAVRFAKRIGPARDRPLDANGVGGHSIGVAQSTFAVNANQPWHAQGIAPRLPYISAALYVASFCIFATILRSHFGFPLDDSSIHQQIARTLAESHVLGFTPGVLSSGSSSLLWTLILAAGRTALPWLSPVFFSLVLSVLALSGIGFVVGRLTARDGITGAAAWALVLAPITSGNILWLGMIGMEHLLFLLLLLVLTDLWLHPATPRQTWRAFALPATALLLALTRPEGVVLVLLLAFFPVRTGRSLRERLLVCAGAIGGWCVTAAISFRASGHLMPQTMMGRRFLAGDNGGLSVRLHFLAATWARFLKNWGVLADKKPSHALALVLLVASLYFAVALVFAIRGLVKARAKHWLILLAMAATIEAMYFVMLPMGGQGGRYITVPLVLFFSLLFFGTVQLLYRFGLGGGVLTAVTVFLLAGSALESGVLWRCVTAAAIDQIQAEHGQVAPWVEANLPAGAANSPAANSPRIAAFDIGRIGYDLHGNLIDLGGLVDSEYLPYLLSHRAGTYLRRHDVEYVILPDHAGEPRFAPSLGLDAAHGVDLETLHTVCADPQEAALALNATGSAWPCQTVYRIHYQQ
jgi:hypothetical protein